MTNNILKIGLSISLTAMMLSCNSIAPTGNKEFQPMILTKSEQQIVNTTNDFSFDFFTACADFEKGKNFCVSPLSVSLCIAMIANGADGNTLTEIVNTLGFEDQGITEVNDFYGKFINNLITADYKTDLLIASSAWVAKDFPINQTFRNDISNYYNATVKNIDFTKSDASNTLNKWCSDKTRGMIKKVFDNIDTQTKLMFINALYFNGKWAKKFDKNDTYEETFHGIEGDINMSFMHHTFTNVSVEMTEEFQICSIPYGNGAFSFVVIMPGDKNADFNSFAKGLDAEKWDRWTSIMGVAGEVELKMPKFKASYSTQDNLIPILKELGINDAFNDAADFSGISDIPLFISEGQQNTEIEVDESGTKAAAVTHFSMKCMSAGPMDHIVFDIDRPFVFAIRECSTNSILFIGAKVK